MKDPKTDISHLGMITDQW